MKHSYEARRIAVPALTDLTIKNLPPGLHFDARLTSFGIRVGKTKKTWVVIKGKNRTKVSLGHYPALSLHDARRKALMALASPARPLSASRRNCSRMSWRPTWSTRPTRCGPSRSTKSSEPSTAISNGERHWIR